MIKTRNIDVANPSRYQIITFHGPIPSGSAGTYNQCLGAWAFSQIPLNQARGPVPTFAKVVDMIISCSVQGTGGTSVTFLAKKNNTTMMLTNGVYLLAAAASTAIDAKNELSAVTNVTRPVLKTDSTILLKKGDVLSVDLVVAGTYTGTLPQFGVQLVIDPQV